MDLLKKYIKRNKAPYFISVLFAILGVISNLFVYIILSKMIISLIDGSQDFYYYINKIFLILSCLIIKEVFMFLSTMISHKTAYKNNEIIRKSSYGKTNIEKESVAGYITNKTSIGNFQLTQGYRRERDEFKDKINSSNKPTNKKFDNDSFELAANYLYS